MADVEHQPVARVADDRAGPRRHRAQASPVAFDVVVVGGVRQRLARHRHQVGDARTIRRSVPVVEVGKPGHADPVAEPAEHQFARGVGDAGRGRVRTAGRGERIALHRHQRHAHAQGSQQRLAGDASAHYDLRHADVVAVACMQTPKSSIAFYAVQVDAETRVDVVLRAQHIQQARREAPRIADFFLRRMHHASDALCTCKRRFDGDGFGGIDQSLLHAERPLAFDHRLRRRQRCGVVVDMQLAGDALVELDRMARQQLAHRRARFEGELQRRQRVLLQARQRRVAQEGQSPAPEVGIRGEARAERAVTAGEHARQLFPQGGPGHRIGIGVTQLRAIRERGLQGRPGRAIDHDHAPAATRKGVGGRQPDHAGTDHRDIGLRRGMRGLRHARVNAARS